MNYRKVTAIVRCDVLPQVERGLQALGVAGISVSRVRGYGEYSDFYSHDWLVTHARLETFIPAAQADEVVDCIMETARVGVAGDGIVAVLPVERLLRIRTSEAVAT